MDESHFGRHLRRLALLTALNCTALTAMTSTLLADDAASKQSQPGLRSLLQDGWQLPESDRESVDRKSVDRESVDRDPFDFRHKLTPIKVRVANPIAAFGKSIPARPMAKPGPNLTPQRAVKRRSMPDGLSSPNGFTLPPRKTAPSLPIPSTAAVRQGVSSPSHPSVYGNSLDDLKREALRTIARDSGFGLVTRPAKADVSKARIADAVRKRDSDALPLPKSVLVKSVLVKSVPSDKNPAGKKQSGGIQTDKNQTVRNQPDRIQFGKKQSASKSVTTQTTPSSALMSRLHVNKLREVATAQLNDANDRLRRGATHSAKHLAVQALKNIVAMRDMQSNGNRHTVELEKAFVAMQESGDFGGKFGAVNQQSLKRLVAVHKTRALKDHDLSGVSPFQAMDMYLTESHDHLVAATGDLRAASDALVLLGRIERASKGVNESHSGAVAVMLQSAAVTSDPNNAVAQYDLGSNLLKQGLVKQAAQALGRGVQLSPTRQGYQQLMTAANRLRDDQTVAQCRVALRSKHLKSVSPVRQLSPSHFASTYKPSVQAMAAIRDRSESVKADVTERTSQIKAKPVSTTKRIFSRWVAPKFR